MRSIRVRRPPPRRWVISPHPEPGRQWARFGQYARLLLVAAGRHRTLVYRGDELVAEIHGPVKKGLRRLQPNGRPRGS